MITVKRKARFAKQKQRRKSAEVPPGRIPRVARLMALAIRFDRLIRDGVVADQAELARLGQVSRARVTQIMDLLHLAPDIQELLLFLQGSERGRDTTAEHKLRSIAKVEDWRAQKRAWQTFGDGA